MLKFEEKVIMIAWFFTLANLLWRPRVILTRKLADDPVYLDESIFSENSTRLSCFFRRDVLFFYLHLI
jgi:hypothetical protein